MSNDTPTSFLASAAPLRFKPGVRGTDGLHQPAFAVSTRMRLGNNRAIVFAASGLLLGLQFTCSRQSSAPTTLGAGVANDAESSDSTATSATASVADGGARMLDASDARDGSTISSEYTISFVWKPKGASAREYSMADAPDQHKVLLLRGVEHGKSYPVVIALHGQPRRGQAPRDYRFVQVVSEVARELVADKSTPPFVLVTPVFRFEGQNWPRFDLGAFVTHVRLVLREHGVAAGDTYVFGHSGAAGCGGEGLNRVAALSPAAVGFFDTCVGAGFAQAVRELSANRVPTLILHSVETAGFQPSQPVEYDANFDFGRVYSKLGLRAGHCPPELPGVPLRRLAYRCASNDVGSTLALVLDTGAGEAAHEALVPVAMRYFVKQYVKWQEH